MTIKVNELPIVTVWYKPQVTIRRVLDGKAFLGTETILGIYTMVVAIRMLRRDSILTVDLGISQVLLSIGSSILFALLITHIEVYGTTVIVKWAGKAVGGVGSWNAVKQTVAWNKLTYLVLYLFPFGIGPLVSPDNYKVDLNWQALLTQEWLLVNWGASLLVLTVIVVMVWRGVIYWRMIAEVHQIKVWRAAIVSLMPITIFVMGIFLLARFFP